MEAAWAMAFEYSLLVEVDVRLDVVAVTLSGVASFGGVGGKLNMGCDTDDIDDVCGDLIGPSSLLGLKGEHHDDGAVVAPF